MQFVLEHSLCCDTYLSNVYKHGSHGLLRTYYSLWNVAKYYKEMCKASLNNFTTDSGVFLQPVFLQVLQVNISTLSIFRINSETAFGKISWTVNRPLARSLSSKNKSSPVPLRVYTHLSSPGPPPWKLAINTKGLRIPLSTFYAGEYLDCWSNFSFMLTRLTFKTSNVKDSFHTASSSLAGECSADRRSQGRCLLHNVLRCLTHMKFASCIQRAVLLPHSQAPSSVSVLLSLRMANSFSIFLSSCHLLHL
jgi:hypothetical protein